MKHFWIAGSFIFFFLVGAKVSMTPKPTSEASQISKNRAGIYKDLDAQKIELRKILVSLRKLDVFINQHPDQAPPSDLMSAEEHRGEIYEVVEKDFSALNIAEEFKEPKWTLPASWKDEDIAKALSFFQFFNEHGQGGSTFLCESIYPLLKAVKVTSDNKKVPAKRAKKISDLLKDEALNDAVETCIKTYETPSGPDLPGDGSDTEK